MHAVSRHDTIQVADSPFVVAVLCCLLQTGEQAESTKTVQIIQGKRLRMVFVRLSSDFRTRVLAEKRSYERGSQHSWRGLEHFIDNENILAYHFNMNESPWRAKWTPDQLTALLVEQQQAFWQRETGLERDGLAQVDQAASVPHAVIISGLRRVGKSTLLAQLAHRLGED